MSMPRANHLFDFVIEKMGLKNDAALSRLVGVTPPLISNLRHGRLIVGPELILKIHDATDIPVREIKKLAGLECLPRKLCRSA